MSKLIVDENLSPDLAATLRQAGHDAIHVNDVKLGATADRRIMDWAAEDHRAIVTCDTDFQTHLWREGATEPSIVRLSQRADSGVIGKEAHNDGPMVPRSFPAARYSLGQPSPIAARRPVRGLPGLGGVGLHGRHA